MAKGRELKGRIKSVENTRKITRTMEMVATSKMKRAADRVASARPYALALGELLSQVYTPELADRFPLLRRPTQVKRVALVVLTANRGLCGGFNTNLLREARARLAELEQQGATVELHVVGKKGIGFFKYLGRALAEQRADISDKPTAADAASLIESLMGRFASGELDAVLLTYAKYKSALSTPPATGGRTRHRGHRRGPGFPSRAVRRRPPRGAVAAVCAQHGVSRAGGNRGG